MATDLAVVRSECAKMTEHLFVVAELPFSKTSELQRQLLACFSFGMIYAEGQTLKLTPPEVHSLVICCLIDTFKYSDAQAAAFSEHLIQCASNSKLNATMTAIIHRGIDGHYQHLNKNLVQLKQNLDGVLRVGAQT
jgi:hypothetical protein